ncbi:MAG: PilW family protein [Chitinispirillales bacterium]|jgi:type II secretory pathway component PulJ|nr:PilW family protein [Chitinispirillales bacterium]
MKTKNKKNTGTTLVELMIYMIVSLIVITAAFKVISRATTGYLHGRSVAKAQYGARDCLTAMSRDIASMGYKAYFEYDGDKPNRNIDSVGYTRTDSVVGFGRHTMTGNSAAFFFYDGENTKSDTLEFFRIRTNEKGERIARERVKYYLDEDNNVIIRELWTMRQTASHLIFGEWGIPDTTYMASNIVALNFRFSENGDDLWISKFDNANPVTGTIVKRNNVRNVEIALLVKGQKKGKGIYGQTEYIIGDRVHNTSDNEFIHRLYRQVVEIPNNARGN